MSECILWTKTADLLKDHGYEMSGSCPVVPCSKEVCVFQASITETADNAGKLYETLEKNKSRAKLASLRRELVNYQLRGDKFSYEL